MGEHYSYEALGLVASTNPTLSGGIELTTSHHNDRDTRSNVLSSVSESSESRKSGGDSARSIPRGYGRIIRDENGDIIDVDLGEEDAEDVEETSNHLIEDIAAPLDQEGAAGWITLGSKFTHGRSTSTPIIQCE